MKNFIHKFNSLTIFEIVLTLVLAVALGVSYWGWTFVYDFAKPVLKVYGLQYLSSGFWIFVSIFIPFIIRKPGVGLIASVMAAFIIRKPGVGLIASVMAAFVESLLTRWGLISVLWGFVQGFGAEIIFMCFMYRKWDFKVLLLASSLSAILSYGLDYFFYDYGALSLSINGLQLISFIISAAVFAAIWSYSVGMRLKKLGLLDQFLIAKEV